MKSRPWWRHLEVKGFFAWYDCWIGWYYSRKAKTLYVCPLPMLGLRFRLKTSCEASGHLWSGPIENTNRMAVRSVYQQCQRCGQITFWGS